MDRRNPIDGIGIILRVDYTCIIVLQFLIIMTSIFISMNNSDIPYYAFVIRVYVVASRKCSYISLFKS